MSSSVVLVASARGRQNKIDNDVQVFPLEYERSSERLMGEGRGPRFFSPITFQGTIVFSTG